MMPLKVVYLDDEPGLCEIFMDNFASPEICIETFTDPKAAISAINDSLPDLVFLDYRLPMTTGVEVKNRLNPSLPVVLLTGDLNINAQDSFVRVFQKPLDFETIEAFIKSHLDQKQVA